MALAENTVSYPNGFFNSGFRLNLETRYWSSTRKGTRAELQALTPEGAYLVTDQPPSRGELVTVGAGPSVNSGGMVEYVERLLGSRWGFFIRFGGQSAPATNGREASRGRADIIVPEPPGMRKEAFDYYERLKRLRLHVMNHYDEDLTLERAADIAALEKTYFSTYFRSKVGVNYRDWVQNLRVRKAMDRMRKRNESITDVAFSVGFGDLRTFQRAFRKWSGMTPRQYKKLVSQ